MLHKNETKAAAAEALHYHLLFNGIVLGFKTTKVGVILKMIEVKDEIMSKEDLCCFF
jgi:hypothetical protein